MNQIKSKVALVLFLLFLVNISNSQSILRSSINCFGSSNFVDNVLFCQTAGQSSNTNCFKNEQVLRQGFQQPYRMSGLSFSNNDITVDLYPNPATTETHIVINENLTDYEVIITTITGKELFRKLSTGFETKIDCTLLTNGLYIVSIEKKGKLYSTNKLVINR